jgi:hypothetical protein
MGGGKVFDLELFQVVSLSGKDVEGGGRRDVVKTSKA